MTPSPTFAEEMMVNYQGDSVTLQELKNSQYRIRFFPQVADQRLYTCICSETLKFLTRRQHAQLLRVGKKPIYHLLGVTP